MDFNRLSWASRRGMLELDLILGPFLESFYSTLPQEDKERYWKLLACEDQQLYSWFLQKGVPEDSELRHIVEIVLEHTGMPVARGNLSD